jgi:hypothetical protein
LNLQRIQIVGIDPDVADNGKQIRAILSTDFCVGQSAVSPVDLRNRNEQEQVVVELMHGGLAIEAIVGTGAELEASHIGQQSMRPLVDRGRNYGFLIRCQR